MAVVLLLLIHSLVLPPCVCVCVCVFVCVCVCVCYDWSVICCALLSF